MTTHVFYPPGVSRHLNPIEDLNPKEILEAGIVVSFFGDAFGADRFPRCPYFLDGQVSDFWLWSAKADPAIDVRYNQVSDRPCLDVSSWIYFYGPVCSMCERVGGGDYFLSKKMFKGKAICVWCERFAEKQELIEMHKVTKRVQHCKLRAQKHLPRK